jgi:hypothetical protein
MQPLQSVLKVPALVVQLVDFDNVFFLYFFTKDLMIKVPPHPEYRRTFMHLKSLPFQPALQLYIHPSVIEDKHLVFGFLLGLKSLAALT